MMLNRARFCMLALAFPLAASAGEMVCPIGEILPDLRALDAHAAKVGKTTFNATNSVYEVHDITRGYQIIGTLVFEEQGMFEKVADEKIPGAVKEIRISQKFRDTYAQLKEQGEQIVRIRAPLFSEMKFIDRLLSAQNCAEFRAPFKEYLAAAETQLDLLEKDFGGTGQSNSSKGDYRDKVQHLAERCQSKLAEASNAARTGGGDSDLVISATILPKSRTMNSQDLMDRLEGEYMRLIKAQKNSKEVFRALGTYVVGREPKLSNAMTAQLAKMCEAVAQIEASVFQKVQDIDQKTLAAAGIQ